MLRYLPILFFLFFGLPLLADPDCPEPSTTKDQIGLTFDPSSMPDKIFDADKKEVDAKIRLDELDRLLKHSFLNRWSLFTKR